jgi:hypothetical protein
MIFFRRSGPPDMGCAQLSSVRVKLGDEDIDDHSGLDQRRDAQHPKCVDRDNAMFRKTRPVQALDLNHRVRAASPDRSLPPIDALMPTR